MLHTMCTISRCQVLQRSIFDVVLERSKSNLALSRKELEQIEKNLDSIIKGKRREHDDSDVHQYVKGSRREHIVGDQSLTVGMNQYEHVAGSHALETGGELHLAAHENLMGEAWS